MPPVTDLATAFLDARSTGRDLRFRSESSPTVLGQLATRLWPLESFVHEGGRTVVDGTIAPGLHLSVMRSGVEDDLYEVVLLREPTVSQEEAGAAWGRVCAQIWQLADD
jgi:hypothetical protein